MPPKKAPNRQQWVCPGCCRYTSYRLLEHTRGCPEWKKLQITTDATKQRSRKITKALLQNYKIKKQDVQRLLLEHDPDRLLTNLIEFLRRKGHMIDAKPDEDTAGAITGPSVMPAKRRRVIIESDEEESEPNVSCIDATQPFIRDPNETKNYSSGSRKKLQEQGLYRRLDASCNFMQSLKQWLHQQHGNEKTKDAEKKLALIGRILGFIFDFTSSPTSEADDAHSVMKLLKRRVVIEFFNRVEKCKVRGETVGSYEKSMKDLIRYLRTNFDISRSEEHCLRLLDEYIGCRQKGTSRKILAEQRDAVLQEDPSKLDNLLKESRALLTSTKTLSMVEKAKKAILEYPTSFLQKDYIFFTRYCIAILYLGYPHRAQTSETMTLDEFQKRETHADGSITIDLKQHKTSRSRFIQHVLLTSEEAEYLEFYEIHCRRNIIENDAGMTAERKAYLLHDKRAQLFLHYDKKTPYYNPGREAEQFQRAVGAKEVIKSRQLRRAVETASSIKLADKPHLQEAIHNLEGHSRTTAIRRYVRKRGHHALPAKEALNIIAGAHNELSTNTTSASAVNEEHPAVKEVRNIHKYFDKNDEEVYQGLPVTKTNERMHTGMQAVREDPVEKEQAAQHMRFDTDDDAGPSGSRRSSNDSLEAEAGESSSSSSSEDDDDEGGAVKTGGQKLKKDFKLIASHFPLTAYSKLPTHAQIMAKLKFANLSVDVSKHAMKSYYCRFWNQQRSLKALVIAQELLPKMITIGRFKSKEEAKERMKSDIETICKKEKWTFELGRFWPTIWRYWESKKC